MRIILKHRVIEVLQIPAVIGYPHNYYEVFKTLSIYTYNSEPLV
jgi:hypothetical protein